MEHNPNPLTLNPNPNPNPNPKVSRDHIISENPETGAFFIAGGKWTTWREMAEDIVTKVRLRLRDKPSPLTLVP